MSDESGNPPLLEVIPGEVKNVGRAAYRIATELRSGSTVLDTEVRALMDTWKGNAADVYGAGWDEMHRGTMQVWDALFELAEKLGVTADNYRVADSGNASAFSSLDL